MGGVNKLLDRQLKAFSGYALLILLVSTPVYYLVVDWIWVSELDEHNRIQMERLEQSLRNPGLDSASFQQFLHNWKAIQGGSSIQTCDTCVEGYSSIYDVNKSVIPGDSIRKERIRGLEESMRIQGRMYLLRVETNVEESDETLIMLFSVTAFFFLLLLGGLLLLNRRIAYSSWKPFEQILAQLRAFDLSAHQDIHLPETAIAEFNELNQTLKLLIDKSVSAYANQKAFTENASHELQTPLALLKSKLEILSQNPDLTASQLQAFQELALPLTRLTRINKNLLLLAKLDNRQFPQTEEVALDEVIKEGLEMLSGYAEQKEIEIDIQMENPVRKTLNLFLAETLFQNLLSNAIRYTPQHGKIHGELDEKHWIISNSGEKALNKSTLYQRFASRSGQEEGNGLGLAIVYEIARQFHWKIHYEFTAEMHVFRLDF